MKSLTDWQREINEWAEGKGWNTPRPFGDNIALFHTELSEAYEDFRNHRGLTEVYYENDGEGNTFSQEEVDRIVDSEDFKAKLKPCGIPIEIADLAIRLLHFCAQEGINLDEMIELKMAYNQKRPYRHGGKAT